MKTRITNIPEAVKRLDAFEKTIADTIADIRNFLADMSGKLAAFMQLKGDQSMKPREILEYYQRLGWDAPKVGSAKLDEGISGGLSYLLNRKGILRKQKGIFDQADAPRRNKPRSTYSSASLKRSLQSITGCF